MPLGDYGLSQAFTFSLQNDQKLADLRYDELMSKRAQAESEAKAKLFADDLEFQNSVNSFDNALIKQKNTDRIKNIGRYVRENPDWATNVAKRTELNLMKRELMDNPDTIRGVASDSAYKQFVNDFQNVAKNPERHNVAAYENVNKEWDNYLRFGNQYGQEAAQQEGYKAFVYNKPRDFVDINDRWKDIGTQFKDVKTRPIKGGRNAYEEYADPNSLEVIARQEYLQNKEQYDIEASRQGVDPIEYIKAGVNAHIPKKKDFGDYGLSDSITLAKMKRGWELDDMQVPPNKSAYQEAFVNKMEGVVSPDVLEQTYTSKPRHFIYDNKGQNQIDNTGNRVYYTGVHKWIEGRDQNGRPQRQKVVETYTYLTPEQAKEKGIYEDGAWNPFQGEEIVPEWNKQAEIIKSPNAKGEEVKMIKVKSLMPVELNESNAGSFDNQVHLSKSKLIASQPNENTSSQEEGAIVTDKKTGKSYRKVPGGYEPLN